MAGSLTLAAVHGGGIPSPVTILLGVAAVGYVLWSRLRGQPLNARRLLVLPVVLTVIGVADLTGSSAPRLSGTDVGFLAAGVAISVLLGAARGGDHRAVPRWWRALAALPAGHRRGVGHPRRRKARPRRDRLCRRRIRWRRDPRPPAVPWCQPDRRGGSRRVPGVVERPAQRPRPETCRLDPARQVEDRSFRRRRTARTVPGGMSVGQWDQSTDTVSPYQVTAQPA